MIPIHTKVFKTAFLKVHMAQKYVLHVGISYNYKYVLPTIILPTLWLWYSTIHMHNVVLKSLVTNVILIYTHTPYTQLHGMEIFCCIVKLLYLHRHLQNNFIPSKLWALKWAYAKILLRTPNKLVLFCITFKPSVDK